MIANTVQLLSNVHRGIQGVKTVLDVFARPWLPETFYVTNRHVRPTDANNFFYFAQNVGVTGPNEPIWPEAIGGTVLDGTITWEAVDDDDPKGWPTTQVSTNGFPFVVTSEATGDWRRQGSDTYNIRRFQVTCFIHPYEQAFYGVARNDALIYLQRFGLAYMKYERRYLTPTNEHMIVRIPQADVSGLSDIGLIVTDYMGDSFYGLQWNLSVEIRTFLEVNSC